MSFLLPKSTVQKEVCVKKSRFIGVLSPVDSVAQVKTLVARIKRQYPNARHYCTAYMIGHPQQPTFQSCSDDGEPSGTAGKPILNVLKQRSVSYSLVVVVRYFGGVKLGASGLVRAYSSATKGVCDQATLIPYVVYEQVNFSCAFDSEHRVRQWLERHNCRLMDVSYRDACYFTLEIPAQYLDTFRMTFSVCSGSAEWP